jgi:hypothetical protein
MFWILGILFSVGMLFLGGVERLENTFLGYVEFGQAGEKVSLIRMVVLFILGFSVFGFVAYVL